MYALKFSMKTLGVALMLAAATTGVPPVAEAAAPLTHAHAPGFYPFALGELEVTVLSDGTPPLPAGKVLQNISPKELETALRRAFLTDSVKTSFNEFLVNTGTRLILIDTGAGAYMGPVAGHLLANLKEAGYTPEQVDEVYVTHMHTDHVGGLMVGNKLAFPNAIVRADEREAAFWLSPTNRDAAPAAAKPIFQAAIESLGPYVSAGRFKPFNGKITLTPGITAIPTPGHTPGHTSYLVESNGQRLMVLGDLVHVAAVQFADPNITMAFDTQASSAQTQRAEAFASAAREGYWVAVPHVPFPGIGHIRVEGRGYAWVPANYEQAP